MSKLYDEDQFFHNYLKLREDRENFNDLFEQPKMMELFGEVRGQRILEIGCGYGATTMHFIKSGAAQVFAFDASENMIGMARRVNSDPAIQYEVMDACDLSRVDGTWDKVYSSLVFHYIEDLKQVFTEIHRLLKADGILTFSMEHPIVTAGYDGGCDLPDENGVVQVYQMDHYNEPGKRTVNWLDTDVVKYHHTVSGVLNDLIESGFVIERVEEPIPESRYLQTIKRMRQEICRPSYLMCRCRKA